MSLTRVQVEKVMVKRAGKRMTFVDMDGTTISGSNADVVDPISTTLIGMGVTPSDITAPSDSDLAGVSDVNQFLDRCELRLLENIFGNMDMVDMTVGSRTESLSSFTADLERAISRRQAQVQRDYGVGLGTLSGGHVTLNFVQKGDDPVI